MHEVWLGTMKQYCKASVQPGIRPLVGQAAMDPDIECARERELEPKLSTSENQSSRDTGGADLGDGMLK